MGERLEDPGAVGAAGLLDLVQRRPDLLAGRRAGSRLRLRPRPTGWANVEDGRLDQIGALEPKGHGQTQDAEEDAVDRNG